MVDAIVSVFLEKLLFALADQAQILSKHREKFETLRRQLDIMQSFLQDAERLKRKKQTLRTILVQLRDLIYEAQDILADTQVQPAYRNGDSRFPMCLPPRKLSSKYNTGKRLDKITEEITEIKDGISKFLGPNLTSTNSVREYGWSSEVYDHSQVVGLEGDTEKIKDWLFEASDGLLVIGVVGMGGLGKTTIAKKVFNDRRIEVEGHFDRRIWVSVSQEFTLEQIMRSILRSLGDACVGDDTNQLLKKINGYLLGKRYLIVMDDVWSIWSKKEKFNWWQIICDGLPKGKGSSIIVTTRIEEVASDMGVTPARTHRPKFLSEENSWLLFCKVAFAATRGECVYPNLVKVGTEIVEKCKGLPLAIKAVGGVMLRKPPEYIEWKRISDYFRDELAVNDNSVMASLQLSYDELPPHLKSCFLCFSLFPEDCVIEKEQLVHWWIAESFIPQKNGRLSTEAGENCFSELTNRCLVEVVDRAYNGVIHTCKIHDMVRDLVLKIAEDDKFSISDDPKYSRRLGIKSDMSENPPLTNKKLRALLTTTKNSEVNKIPSTVARGFCKSPYLQVLDLSKSIFDVPLSSLLDEVGLLQHLSYLSLSNTHPLIELPASLAKLRNLQILDVRNCQNLRSIPSCIVTFEKLTVLDVNNCGSLEYLPKGLSRLSSLEVLLGFKPARTKQSGGSRISELRSLTRLRMLSLRLTHSDEIADDEVDTLTCLGQLKFLTLNCFDCHDDELTSKVDKLRPPEKLHELSLRFYPGKVSPSWLDAVSLPVLHYLSIISGNLAKMHEKFFSNGGGVWDIRGLKLEALSDLKEKWSEMQQVMPSLRILDVTWCPELENFPIEDAGFKGGVWKKEGI